MLSDMTGRVVIVGGGPMGTAVAIGLHTGYPRCSVLIAEKDAVRRRSLGDIGWSAAVEHTEIQPGDTVVLAVPPQAFTALARQLTPLAAECLVISVMAGVTTTQLRSALRTENVVRTIPNTPAEVSAGMTVLYAPSDVAPQKVDLARDIMAACGKVLVVDDESAVDDATALCGGGPAFVAFYASAMTQFASECGFGEDSARMMVAQVLRGTADLLERRAQSPLQLCREVMTPNGTTEHGIQIYHERGLADIVLLGLRAAAARSRELQAVSNRPNVT